ncbi:sugar ABC transporter substrate-binding protein [Butyrivibrio sp. AE2032]|uniref:sugar ABC transporter substrate-binding protein n=1 Tax=Butyrivibrio sp. AE2032 TaxID=1458463 RepID=UPI0005579980|nr:substrate-binding domain-containing protein [Butyrivibrio sp. AE2032]
MKVSRNRITVTILAGVVLVLFFATVAGLIYYRDMIGRLGEVREEVYEEYPRLYAYIAEDPDSQLSNRIYKEISEYAKENDCYVEMTGQNLSTSYSKADRIDIAISSRVDGIILEGDDSEETVQLIEKATEKGIPVVTVLSDCNGSSRKSYIGLNNYTLGSEYGDQLVAIGEEKKTYPLSALILLDSDDGNADDIIHSAIQQAMTGRNISLSSSVVDTSTPFASEEDVMNILDSLDKIPDVIICLNDRTTESAIQCVVDKNLVGKTTILGYYDSETIRKAIDRGSVYATFAIETKTLARQCVKALNEYYETGFVSQYYPSNFILINRENLSSYDPEAAADEG